MNILFNKTKKNIKAEKNYYNNAITVYKKIKKHYDSMDINKFDNDPYLAQHWGNLNAILNTIKDIRKFLKVCIKINLTPNYSIFFRFVEKKTGVNDDNTINISNINRAFNKEKTIKTSLNINYYIKKHTKAPALLNIWELAINQENSFEYYINTEANYMFLYNYNSDNNYNFSQLLTYLKSIDNNLGNTNIFLNLNLDDKYISKYIKKINKVYAELAEKDDDILKTKIFQKYIEAEEIFQKKNPDFKDKLTPRQVLSNSIRLTSQKKSSKNKTRKGFLSRISKIKTPKMNNIRRLGSRSHSRSRSRSRSHSRSRSG